MAKAWSVQLAAGFSRATRRRNMRETVKGYASVLGAQDPIVSRKVLHSRGTRTLYQIRIGAETRSEANSCAAARKGGACLVLRQLPAPRRAPSKG